MNLKPGKLYKVKKCHCGNCNMVEDGIVMYLSLSQNRATTGMHKILSKDKIYVIRSNSFKEEVYLQNTLA